jgi:hypothetical protein
MKAYQLIPKSPMRVTRGRPAKAGVLFGVFILGVAPRGESSKLVTSFWPGKPRACLHRLPRHAGAYSGRGAAKR